MKKSIFLFAILCFLSQPTSAQTFDQIFMDIGANKLASLSKKMSDTVELCIADEPEFYPKDEALSNIRRFLKSKKVTDFNMIHSGKSADLKSQYWVGKLESKQGNYRVFLYLELGEIIEIRLDKF